MTRTIDEKLAEQMLQYIDHIVDEYMVHREALKEQLLTRQDLRALEFALKHTAPTMGDLAEYMQVAPSRVTALIDSLVVRGLVRREKSAQDRRSSVIVLTQEGMEVTLALRQRKMFMCSSLLSKLEQNEQSALMSILNKMTE